MRSVPLIIIYMKSRRMRYARRAAFMTWVTKSEDNLGYVGVHETAILKLFRRQFTFAAVDRIQVTDHNVQL